MTFEKVFIEFLEAIKRHDWKATTAFWDRSLAINILLPNRAPITDYEVLVESQKEFFSNPNTSFEYKVVLVEESQDLGFGVCHAQVKLDPKQDKATPIQICFLFKKHKGAWKLIFDQNTVLPEGFRT